MVSFFPSELTTFPIIFASILKELEMLIISSANSESTYNSNFIFKSKFGTNCPFYPNLSKFGFKFQIWKKGHVES